LAQRRPQIHVIEETEPRRHHAYDRRGAVVERHGAAQDVRIPIEVVPPEPVTDNHCWDAAGPVFVSGEAAAFQRLHAQHLKEGRGDPV